MDNNQMTMQQAMTAFNAICSMLDERDWHYEKDENKMLIRCKVSGDDLGMSIVMRVNPDLMIISLYSPLPFNVPEERRVDVANAINRINYKIVDGNFELDMSDGASNFRLTSSYRESIIGTAMLAYMLDISLYFVDEYNDRLLAVSKGTMQPENIIKD